MEGSSWRYRADKISTRLWYPPSSTSRIPANESSFTNFHPAPSTRVDQHHLIVQDTIVRGRHLSAPNSHFSTSTTISLLARSTLLEGVAMCCANHVMWCDAPVSTLQRDYHRQAPTPALPRG